MTTTKKWRLSTSGHIGSAKRETHARMWVNAENSEREFNFLAESCGVGSWYISEWVENLEDMPEFSDKILEELYTSFEGELEIEA